MVGDLLRLGRGLEHQPLILPTLYRTVVFSVWVGAFSLLEATVRGLLKPSSAYGAGERTGDPQRRDATGDEGDL